MSEAISYEQSGDVALLTVDDGKANAFSSELIDLFHRRLDEAESSAKSVAILGRPGLLSGGFDLKLIRSGDTAAINEMVEGGTRLLMRLYGHPQPIIVGATGHAVALGAFILLCADYRIGIAGDFKIGLNETAIGLTLPEFGITLARERLSKRKLTEATLGAQLYDPQAASEVGYLDELVESDAIREAILMRANEMATLDSTAFAQTKSVLRGAVIEQVLANLNSPSR